MFISSTGSEHQSIGSPVRPKIPPVHSIQTTDVHLVPPAKATCQSWARAMSATLKMAHWTFKMERPQGRSRLVARTSGIERSHVMFFFPMHWCCFLWKMLEPMHKRRPTKTADCWVCEKLLTPRAELISQVPGGCRASNAPRYRR